MPVTLLTRTSTGLAICAAVALLGGCLKHTGGKEGTPPPPATAPQGAGTAGAGQSAKPATPSQEPTEYQPPAPHGAADNPEDAKKNAAPDNGKTSDAAGGVPTDQTGAVASVIGRDTNPANTGRVTTVVLETTKGKIGIDVHDKWSPQAYLQFLQLVRSGYYDGCPWYRVIDGFAAQSGISPDPTVNAKWGRNRIMDDDLVKHNMPGTVVFNQNGPRTRGEQFFINLSDNTDVLDGKGFVPFGIVVSGLDVAKRLQPISDDDLKRAGLSATSLAGTGGIEQFKKAFPNADYITKAYVLEK
jgi:cyclophilin family peptidyl-prolyl cis-trans isomerase